jgi:endonuclease/exonuclease/phosphatase family metal-dependent hydrolase
MVEGLGELHVLHAPISAKAGRAKVLTLEAIAGALAAPRDHPVVLAGDLNTPQYESREGEVRSFARTRTGRLREGFDERHDDAELCLVPGLGDHGYADAFRDRHGYLARDRSWMYPNGRTGFRLDHLLVRGLDVVAAAYVHAWRERRLSDHSALWADVVPTSSPSGRAAGPRRP